MAPVVVHKENTSALRLLGLWYMKSFGEGFCGDLSVTISCLVENGGFHPRQVQEALNAKKNRLQILELLGSIRQQIVADVLSRPPDGFCTAASAECEEENLPHMGLMDAGRRPRGSAGCPARSSCWGEVRNRSADPSADGEARRNHADGFLRCHHEYE